MAALTRPLYFVSGLLCLLLAIIGVPMPVLPTTPFVLLAAFCFSRSSDSFYQWLLANRLFGPIISDWERHGVIPFKIKCFSTTLMLLMISIPIFYHQLPWWADLSAALLVLIGLGYIWSRPSDPCSSRAKLPSGQRLR